MKDGRLSVAIIGCGAIARSRHIPEMVNNPDVGEVILSDMDGAIMSGLLKRYCIEKSVTGQDAWREIIAMPEVDAVIVSAPNPLHYEVSMAALKEGKHVLVEKPMSIRYDEAMKMQQVAMQSGKLLLVAHHRRHQNCYKVGKRVLESGLLGKVYAIMGEHKQPGPIEWSPNATWFYKIAEEGGGVMLDLGVHMADVICWYSEEAVLKAKAVITQPQSPYEQVKCILELESGCVGVIDVAWGVFLPEKRVKVYGENGVMIVDEYSKNGVSVSLYEPKITSLNFDIPPEPENIAGYVKYDLDDFFIECILKQDLQRKRLQEHVNAMKIVFDAIQSY